MLNDPGCQNAIHDHVVVMPSVPAVNVGAKQTFIRLAQTSSEPRQNLRLHRRMVFSGFKRQTVLTGLTSRNAQGG